mgnify:CR=1 FL=1
MVAAGAVAKKWLAQQHGIAFKGCMTQIGEVITCTGEVTDKFEHAGEQRVRLSLTTANADGQVKLAGEAVIALA